MLVDQLKDYNIILGSASPRRKKLLAKLGFTFTIKRTQKKEIYPKNIDGEKIPQFLAKQKADFISKRLSGNYLLITADTIVLHNNEILHKPKTKDDAIRILKILSGRSHKVISGICIRTDQKEEIFSSVTEVSFNKLLKDEIIYYIENFKPFDKSGSYGIQQWIGHIGIEKINGSYNNVIGLPTATLYQKLKLFI